MTKQTGVALVRVSTDEQAELGGGQQTQDRDIRAYAERNGIELIEVIRDDITGRIPIRHRPGGAQLYDYIDNHRADVVIFWRQDRASRDEKLIEIHQLRHDIKEAGMELHYSDSGREDLSAYGSIVAHVRAVEASNELEKIKARMQGGKDTFVERGNVLVMGRPPYGFDVVEEGGRRVGGRREPRREYLVINQKEAAVVVQVFDWYVNGEFIGEGEEAKHARLSLHQIADRLSKMGVPSRADIGMGYRKKVVGYGVWTPTSVRRLLIGRAAIGEWEWRKVKVKTTHEFIDGQNVKRRVITPTRPEERRIVQVPAILAQPDGSPDLDLFEAAQARLEQNMLEAKRRNSVIRLLRSRIVCGRCGRRYTVATGYQGRHRYICGNNSSSNGESRCTGPHFDGQTLDALVWAWTRELILNPEYLRQAWDEVDRGDEDRLRPIRRRIAEVDEALDRLAQRKARFLRIASMPDAAITEQEAAATTREIEAERKRLADERAEKQRIIDAATQTVKARRSFEETTRQLLNRVGRATQEDMRVCLTDLDIVVRVDVEDGQRVAYVSCAAVPGDERLIVPATKRRPGGGRKKAENIE